MKRNSFQISYKYIIKITIDSGKDTLLFFPFDYSNVCALIN
jgi:hypothetical protein